MIEVVVGGHPNSGTSFLCNLVSEIGYNAGSRLKGADHHNRFGYWEHLGIRGLVWNNMCGPAVLESLPDRAMDAPDSLIESIRSKAVEDDVEVYKDVVLPVVYKAFPGCKRIVITREWSILRDVYYEDVDTLAFMDRYIRYHRLAQDMSDVLFVKYEDFVGERPFRLICEFLEKPYDPSIREVYRPR